jgi:phage gp46-like protein
MTPDPYSGDPRLTLSPAGADLTYKDGQPVMDAGLENYVLISLFTRPGWCGNVLLPPASRIGSDFEETCARSITLSTLADIANAAERALRSAYFPDIKVTVTNPRSNWLSIAIRLGNQAITLDRRGLLWLSQLAKAVIDNGGTIS